MALLRVTRTDSYSMQRMSSFESDEWDAVVNYCLGRGIPEYLIAPDTQFEQREPTIAGWHKVIYRIEFNAP